MKLPGTQGVRFRVILLISLIIVFAYIGISLISAYQLAKPRKLDVSPAPNSYDEVHFPAFGSDDLQISGWYLNNRLSKKAVILIHGKDMSKGSEFQYKFAEFGRALHPEGMSVLLIDLRGHGNSDNSFVSFGIDERYDIIGAANWLKRRGYNPGSIGLLGVSMGAASAIGAAANDEGIGAIVADCSYADILPIIKSKWEDQSGLPYIFLPSTLLMSRLVLGNDLANAKPVVDIPKIAPRPVLIIHSHGDTWVPIHHAYALKAAYPSASIWETGDVDHCLSYSSSPSEYTRTVIEFFLNNL